MFNYNYYYTEEDVDYYSIVATDIATEQANAKRVYETSSYDDFEIYTTYKREYILNDYDNLALEILDKTAKNENLIYFALPISSVMVIVISAYLVMSVGHTKGKEGIDINDLDKVPFEILFAIVMVIAGIGFAVVEVFGETRMEEYYKLMLSGIITAYFVVYTAAIILITTFVKRIKAKILIKTTITGKVVLWTYKAINKTASKTDNALKLFMTSRKNATRLILLIALYILVMLITLGIIGPFSPFLGVVADLAITAYVLNQIIKRINSFETVENHLKGMYEGNNSDKIEVGSLTPEFHNMAGYINDISNGFENAIEEGIKSEKMKTELITNVSHDIKTPLTSIINYVDLLKQENIENEKAKEYIEILEAKSHRLKRLTEDLVEASKASSGNLKLNLEKINVAELINQTTGEFEDKFKESGLEVVAKLPQEEVYIEADSRYMFRVIENLFSNISKYAAKNSRVYVDITTYGDKVGISIKNISAEKLNISPEELMQRFVRGDRSRTTEGSGLGLSISRDLTELQKGKFEIQIDGDLFKVELEFEMI